MKFENYIASIEKDNSERPSKDSNFRFDHYDMANLWNLKVDSQNSKDEQIKILKEALEFYANEHSWYLHKDHVTGSEVRRSIELKDTEASGYLDERENNILKVTAGKIAREALKKIEEME